MLRMEIALFLVLAFVAYMYFTAKKQHTLLHRVFSLLLVVTMVFLTYLYYQYIAVLIEAKTGKKRKLDLPALIFLALTELCVFLLPLYYTVTPKGNFSSGPCAYTCYAGAAFYLSLCFLLLLLFHFGKPRYPPRRADRTENVHALLKKSGQPPFPV